MSTYEARLAALREQLKADRLDGFVVPLTDEHMSEYVGSYAQRLAWLTGFQGSAGAAAVLPAEAAIFVDGRYTLAGPRPGRRQALELPVGAGDQHRRLAEGACARRRPDRLRSLAPHQGLGDQGARGAGRQGRRAGRGRSATRSTRSGPTSPSRRKARLVVHPDEFAGKSSAAKRQEMADWLKEQKADAAVLSALDSIAWTFNVRGQDVEHTPVALSFALVHDDGTADLFVASEKIGDDVRQHLGNGVRVHERARVRAASAPRSPARRWSPIPSGRSRRSSRRSRRPARRSSRSATRRSFPRRSRTRPRSRATGPPRRATAPP